MTKRKLASRVVEVEMNLLRSLNNRLQEIIIAVALVASGLAGAGPVINYTNTIAEIDADLSGTFGDSDADYYTVGLRLSNGSNGFENSATNLIYNTNLEDHGAFNLRDYFSVWTPGTNATGNTVYDLNGIHLEPTLENTVFYDVQANQVIGWDTATVSMEAETGPSNTVGATVPVIPEPATAGLLAVAGIGALAFRKIFSI